MKHVQRVRINGNVPLDNWADVFRAFIGPTRGKVLKRQRLGINFAIGLPADQPWNEIDPALNAMQGS